MSPCSQANYSDSITSPSKGQEGKPTQNGEHPALASLAGTLPAALGSANGQAHADAVKQKVVQAPAGFEGEDNPTSDSSKDDETILPELRIQVRFRNCSLLTASVLRWFCCFCTRPLTDRYCRGAYLGRKASSHYFL